MYTQSIYNCKRGEEKKKRNRYKHVVSDDVTFIAKAVTIIEVVLGFFEINNNRRIKKTLKKLDILKLEMFCWEKESWRTWFLNIYIYCLKIFRNYSDVCLFEQENVRLNEVNLSWYVGTF